MAERPPSPRVLTMKSRPMPSIVRATGADDRELPSDALLLGRREVLIRHGNETYRLRHTRNDKLILTK